MASGFERLVNKRRRSDPGFPRVHPIVHFPRPSATQGPSSKYTKGSTANRRARRKIGLLP